MGKQRKTAFKYINIISTSRPLQLLNLNLFGPSQVASLGGKFYAFVIVDNFSRFTWILFLTHKNEACSQCLKFCKKVQNENNYMISKIRSDHGGEFENYARTYGYEHNFSTLRTPQQNEIVERKNRTPQEMA